jgi:hypothetical protein
MFSQLRKNVAPRKFHTTLRSLNHVMHARPFWEIVPFGLESVVISQMMRIKIHTASLSGC